MMDAQSKIKGNREVKSEQTGVPAFNALSIADEFDVVLIKSSYPAVTLEADSNLHSAVNFSVSDSILNFQLTKNIKRFKELKVMIRYTNKLKTITLSGDVDVEAENTIELPALNLTLNDDAKLEADIVADEFNFQNNNDSSLKLFTNLVLKVESKTATLNLRENSNNIMDINTENLNINTFDNAELNIEGFAYYLELFSTNSSSVKGENLLTNVTKLAISEKADVEINVTETLNIDASGSSTIELYGEPKIQINNFINEASISKKEQ
jgi:hypothetical protein